MILDEADYAIDRFAAYFDSDTALPLGLVSLKYAKQALFLSATYDKFARAFLLKCFNVTESKFASFKTATQIVNKTSDEDIDKPHSYA